MKVPFVDLKAQYLSIKGGIDPVIQEILDTTRFIGGKPLGDFEKNFADFCNKKFCVGLSSGTTALELAYLAAGIGHGDEVITVPNTFIATTETITKIGAKIKFVGIDKDSYTVDPNKIEQAITEKTKAIVPVHLYGQCADMNVINEIAQKHNLVVIEDCAQAHDAELDGKKTPVGKIGCFSFFPGKNLGAYGDAGAIVTDDEEIATKAAMLNNHGRAKGEKYMHEIEGTNYRMDSLQAAILNVKLKHLGKWTGARRGHAKLYNELLSGIVVTPIEKNGKHVYHLYVIRTEERDGLMDFLKQNDISAGVHYPTPLHLQPAYQHLGLKEGAFPIIEAYSKEVLSLPIYAELTEDQIRFVVDKIKEFKNVQ